MSYNADEILDRMRSDSESDWPSRLLEAMYSPRRVRQKDDLTLAEARVVNAASHGLTDAEIGVVLGVHIETVKSHLKHARARLAAKNTTHAVAIALRKGLIA